MTIEELDAAAAEAALPALAKILRACVEGGAAERLYRSLRWTLLGVVPRFALTTDRSALEGSAFFWKEVA